MKTRQSKLRTKVSAGSEAKSRSTVTYLSDGEVDALAFQIIDLLHGVPMSQAIALLEHQVPELLRAYHTVNARSRIITMQRRRLEGSSGDSER